MKIAVFHHSRLSGGRNYLNYSDTRTNLINPKHARSLFLEQMKVLVDSRLYENANEIVLGLNGEGEDADFVEANHPPGSKRFYWGTAAEGLLPTMRFVQQWIKTHPDWFVCFWHMKGALHPNDPLYVNWRLCGEKHIIWNWRICVSDLQNGMDAVGPHWLTPEEFHPIIEAPIFGGVFWWAKAEFLLKLPPLPDKFTCTRDWYIPEHWIGSGPLPMIKDYAHHWPGIHSCGNALK